MDVIFFNTNISFIRAITALLISSLWDRQRESNIWIPYSGGYGKSLETCSYLTGDFCHSPIYKSFADLVSEMGSGAQAGTQTKICKIIEKSLKYLIHFFCILSKSMFNSSERSMSSCVCFHAFLCSRTRPPLSRSIFRRFIPEAVVQYQNYHINQSANARAADLKPPGSFCACLSLFLLHNICLSMPHLFQTHLFAFRLVLETFRNKNVFMWRFQKPTVNSSSFLVRQSWFKTQKQDINLAREVYLQ